MSARDRFKNSNMLGLDNESGVETIVDDIQRNLEKEADIVSSTPEAPKAKEAKGRRRKFDDDAVTKFVNVQLLDSEVKFLEKYGGEFGGKTGYIRKLVQEEMAKVLEK